MDIGRPTDYNELAIPRALEYLATHVDLGDPVPSIAGLAVFMGTSRQTLYNWGQEQPAFFDILEDLRAQQEKALLAGGLTGRFNSPITKLMMMKHGYTEKQEVDHRSGDGSMSPRTLDDFYAEINSRHTDADTDA